MAERSVISAKPISTAAIGARDSGFSWADTVPDERVLYVVGESRILAVPAEPEYTVVIPAETRIIKIPADRDTLTIGESV